MGGPMSHEGFDTVEVRTRVHIGDGSYDERGGRSVLGWAGVSAWVIVTVKDIRTVPLLLV